MLSYVIMRAAKVKHESGKTPGGVDIIAGIRKVGGQILAGELVLISPVRMERLAQEDRRAEVQRVIRFRCVR